MFTSMQVTIVELEKKYFNSEISNSIQNYMASCDIKAFNIVERKASFLLINMHGKSLPYRYVAASRICDIMAECRIKPIVIIVPGNSNSYGGCHDQKKVRAQED
jgi:hypothetical protein